MPTYEYVCTKCGQYFEIRQSMKDEPLRICPECGAQIQRQISGGTGFIFKSSGATRRDSGKSCSLEETGKTCCGADRRCSDSPCGD